MLTASALARHDHLRHAFFTRAGGASDGIYASLNCGPGSGDEPKAVTENRRRAMARLDLPPEALATLDQVHGTTVATVTGPADARARPRADALVSRLPGIALGILTADCAPVLFADPEACVIGAAHAGWRGALDGVLEATVRRMVEIGATQGRIVAAIGPCIGQPSYEVGAEFETRFLAADPGSAAFFTPGRARHCQFDLAAYVARRLARLDIAAVERIAADTCADPARFFSYRRAVLKGEPDYGRMLAAIAIMP